MFLSGTTSIGALVVVVEALLPCWVAQQIMASDARQRRAASGALVAAGDGAASLQSAK